MSDDGFIYWRSINGMAWVQTYPPFASDLQKWLIEHPGEIYDESGDGKLRYRCDKAAVR